MPKFESILKGWYNNLMHLPGSTLNWCGIILGHSVFIPTMLALLTALSDRTPSVDIVIFVQAFLFLTFLRSIATKDTIALLLNTTGWFIQVVLLSLIVFK